MSDYDRIGSGFLGLFNLLVWCAVIAVPLAAWKLVDIGIWVCRHVNVGWR